MPDLIDAIIAREGREFTNRGTDRGGPTRFGITAATLGEYRRLGRPATAAEVEALDEPEARAIYAAVYITGPGFDRIADPRLRDAVVDFGVHSGQVRAAVELQHAAGVRADGRVGPVTLAAVAKADPEMLRRRVLAARLRLLGRLITRDPSQAANAAGWMDRVADQVEA